jgi:hypothetical protein
VLIVPALPRQDTMTAVAIMSLLSHRKHGLARDDPEASGLFTTAAAATDWAGTGGTLPACPSAVRYIAPGPSQGVG